MGYALAEAARDAGARVTLISGPVTLDTPDRIKVVRVNSALDMLQAAESELEHCEIFIVSAAVADYRPAEVADQKVKSPLTRCRFSWLRIRISSLRLQHTPHPFTVGFAAETQDVEHYARGKLARKNLDMIVANDVSRSDTGFNSDNNAVNVYWPEGQCQFDVMNKQILARELIDPSPITSTRFIAITNVKTDC